MLEAATATATKPAARKSAATTATAAESRPSRTAWGGGHDASRNRRHRVQIVHEHVRIKARSVPALIPRRRLRINILKRLAPVFFYAQRHRKWQKLFKHLRSVDHPIKTIRLHVRQKVLKTQHAFQRTRACNCPCRHEPSENADNCRRQYARHNEGQRRHPQHRGKWHRAPDAQKPHHHSARDIRSPYAVRPAPVISVSDQRFEDSVFDGRKIPVELVVQVRERYCFTRCGPARKKSIHQLLLMWLKRRPFRRRFLQMENIILVVYQPHHAARVFFLNRDESTHC